MTTHQKRAQARQNPAPDGGFGMFGRLDYTEGGLVCHECGRAFRHLGLHAWRAHGMRADDYRRAHGLARSRGLVAADVHEAIRRNAARRMNTAAGETFVAARNPARAAAVRLAAGQQWAPQVRAEHARRTAARNRSRRSGRVIVCEWCGAAFCPLVGAARRRFCTRSCASRAGRQAACRGVGKPDA